MRIGVVRFRGKDVDCRALQMLGTSVKSIAHICHGKKFYGHTSALEQQFDFVILVGCPRTRSWYLTKGKPKLWSKVLFFPAVGGVGFNDTRFISQVNDMNVDGFIHVPCDSMNIFKMFNKPVIELLTPYIFDNDIEIRSIPKLDNKVALDIKHLSGDPVVNFMYTLCVFSKLSSNINGVVSTNPAAPYRISTKILNKLVRIFGLERRIKVNSPNTRGDYLKSIADCKVMISMDKRIGSGRPAVDCASLGIYNIGSYNFFKEYFFPDLITEKIDDAVELVNKCLNSDPYVPPADKVNKLKPKTVKKKLIEDLSRL